jgi:hypothetical protein
LKTDQKILNDILINDVLGFICEKNSRINIKNIVFPDIPLRRNVKTLNEEKKMIFTEKITENILKYCEKEKTQCYIFTFSQHAEKGEPTQNQKIVHIDNNPTTAMISKNFLIFLFAGSFLKKAMNDRKVDDFLISLLKKRYLNATNIFDNNFINNAFVLETVPDIIVVQGLGEAIQTNYKGVTLLTLSENTSWIINLKTREIIKLNTT